jgi:hypothetical protein
MVNNMLFFILWYFVSVWKNWDQSYEKKKVEDLGLVDPIKALEALVYKWVLLSQEFSIYKNFLGIG